MIQQLVLRIIKGVPADGRLPAIPGVTQDDATAQVLAADPFDLALHQEQVWDAFNPWASTQPPADSARASLWELGAFKRFLPVAGTPAWDHLGYSYVIENTRAVQILRRVVHQYRAGENLGIPSLATQRWLDTTETLLFGAGNPMAGWLSANTMRQDAEAVRRNAYWRLLGLDLAFGTDDNRPPTYDKPDAANTNFAVLFEALLIELWQAIGDVRNASGASTSDDERIFRIAGELQLALRARRQSQMLAREELAAATALGWVELTLSADTPVVIDLKATAPTAAARLQRIGERVGLPAHGKSSSLLSMGFDLSLLLRTLESGVITGPGMAWVLHREQMPPSSTAPAPIGASSRRVITEWGAATGKDLKVRREPT